MYAVAKLRGLTRADPPRPLLPLPKAAQEKVAEALRAAKLT
jgi:4-hydroxy-tetrahydrodipicolinate synthase